jgi:NADH:ubiquinone oxidoreductase subunit 2 (subunit N)
LPFFLLSALFSILIGSISAIYQKRVKRLLAYSTISHTGFVLFGIVCMSIDSINSLVFYLVIYSGLTILLFSLLIYANITSVNFPAFIAN